MKGSSVWLRLRSRLPYPLSALLRDAHRADADGSYLAVVLRRMRAALRAAWSLVMLPARPPLPIRLQAEATNRCNIFCVMCGREFRDIFEKDMPTPDFRRLIDAVRPAYVTLSGDGEPLLDRELPEKIAWAKKRGCVVVLPSNMTITSAGKARRLAEAGLDMISFSIDGATTSSFEQVRKGSKFEKVLGNIRTALGVFREMEPRAPEVRAIFVIQRGNLTDFREAFRLQRQLGMTFGLAAVKYLDRPEVARQCRSTLAGLEGLERALAEEISREHDAAARAFYRNWLTEARQTAVPQRPSRICYKPWTTAYVDARGDVYPCCYAGDKEKHLLMGNAFNQPFREVWRGRKYSEFRRKMLDGKSTIPVCSTCPQSDEGLHDRLRRWLSWLPVPIHYRWKNRAAAQAAGGNGAMVIQPVPPEGREKPPQ